MTASWNAADICEAFEAYRDLDAQLLGYKFVFRALNPERENCQTIFRLWLWPGKAALRFVQMSGKRVVAVDSSQQMLSIASEKRSHPLIAYQLIRNEKLELEDNSVDGAMACFVFISIVSEVQILNIVREVHRVIRPGSPFVILDTNPDATGVEFAAFRSGKRGENYGHGEAIEVFLPIPWQDRSHFYDYYWPKSMYRKALSQAGFSEIELHEYTLADIPKNELQEFEELNDFHDWKEEWHSPPFVMFRAVK